LTPESGTDRLSSNVCKQLPIYATKIPGYRASSGVANIFFEAMGHIITITALTEIKSLKITKLYNFFIYFSE
jgi:hypothetical protein